MSNSRIAVFIFFVLSSAANFLGYTRWHDSLCLDNRNVRLEWCFPHGPHLVPAINNTTLAWEVITIIIAGIAWFRVARKPE